MIRVVLFVFFVCSSVLQASTFDPVTQFQTIALTAPVDGYYSEHTIADADGDGDNELIVSRANWPPGGPTVGEIVVYEVLPSGTLVTQHVIPLPVGRPLATEWFSPRVVDVDADGLLDIAAWSRANNTQGILDVAYAQPAGGYVVQSYPTPDSDAGYRMEMADMTGDGLVDVLTTNGGFGAPGTLFVMRNDVNPSLRFAVFDAYPMGSDATGVFVADVDQDGQMDAAVATHDTGALGARLHFFPGPSVEDLVPGDASRASSIGFGDVDNDGLLDVVTNAAVPHSGTNYLWVYLQASSRVFSPPTQLVTTGQRPKMPLFADFDGDGGTELVASVTADRTLNFFGRDTLGVLEATPLPYSTPELLAVDHGFGTNPNALTIGDADNDGDLDIVVGILGLVLVQNIGPVNQTPIALCTDVSGLAASANLCAAAATVDNGSFDPDGDPFTISETPIGPYGLGDTLVTLTIEDAQGEMASCQGVVNVVDVNPPTLVGLPSPTTLWPPNHSYHSISLADLSLVVSDACDTSLSSADVTILHVTSDEPDDVGGGGDGHTTDDIVIAPDCRSLQLRSERQGAGDGRVYTVHLEAVDSSGNVAGGAFAVGVPKSKKSAPIDSGPAQTWACGDP